MILDVAASQVRIHTFAEGLFSKLAHDLELVCDGLTGRLDGETAHVVAPVDRIRVAGVLGKGGAVDAQKLSASDRDDILAKMRREVFHASDGVVKIEATSASMRLVVPSGRALTLAAGSFERGEGRVTARGRFSVACSAIGSDVVRGPMNAFRVKDEVVVLYDVAFVQPA